MPLSLSIITPGRSVLERNDVLSLTVPTTEGQITILPKHAPLMASLAIGELIVRFVDGNEPIAVHGGFIQVVHDQVTVLADAAERAEEIDEARAEAARERAVARLEGRLVIDQASFDVLRAQLALRRALLRISVRRRHSGTGVPSLR